MSITTRYKGFDLTAGPTGYSVKLRGEHVAAGGILTCVQSDNLDAAKREARAFLDGSLIAESKRIGVTAKEIARLEALRARVQP